MLETMFGLEKNLIESAQEEEEACKKVWQELPHFERNLYNEAKKTFLLQIGTVHYTPSLLYRRVADPN